MICGCRIWVQSTLMVFMFLSAEVSAAAVSEGEGQSRLSLLSLGEESSKNFGLADSGERHSAIDVSAGGATLAGWEGSIRDKPRSSSDEMSIMHDEGRERFGAAYTLIPLRQFEDGYGILAIDGAGERIVYSDRVDSPMTLTILRRSVNHRGVIRLDVASTTGVGFSGDGKRLYYRGRANGRDPIGLMYVDVESKVEQMVSVRGRHYYSVDHSGGRVVYQEAVTGTGLQYVAFDEPSGRVWQITDDPEVISSQGQRCSDASGSTPLIEADGSAGVFITGARLGVAPEDPEVRCRVFRFDVETERLEYVVGLPAEWEQIGRPALSGDGRWLSFAAAGPIGGGVRRGIPVLVDLETAEIAGPLVDTGRFTSFDSTVTRDGRGVIISSQADLDPQAGNDDHNMELFYVDRETRRVEQITQTMGGIGGTPGGCAPYHPSVSYDGDVLVFGQRVINADMCRIDGPQRSETNGLWLSHVRAVRKRPGNSEVVFDSVAPQQAVAGELFELRFEASDADGDPISFYAQVPGPSVGIPDIIPGSTFTDHYDGTATLAWRPRAAQGGRHVLRVVAFDEGGGERWQDVEITVLPEPGSAPPCTGACSEPGVVSVGDIVTLVNISLGIHPLANCPAADGDGDGQLTVAEILVAVGHALSGCPG